jgi:predicted MFS family arabinose efflux permease
LKITTKNLEIEDDKLAKDNADKYRFRVITILCLVNFTANSAYSSIAPFYPKEAIKKGVPESLLGFIFSGYSVSMCIFAPLFGKMLT